MQWFCKIQRIAFSECVSLESHKKKKICWLLQQGTENSIFRVIFRISFMLSGPWFCKTLIPYSTYFELKVLIAECVTSKSHNKQTVDCRSKEQTRAISELSFGMGLMLSMQWICNILFRDSPYFESEVLIAECVNLESPEKKICWLLHW